MLQWQWLGTNRQTTAYLMMSTWPFLAARWRHVVRSLSRLSSCGDESIKDCTAGESRSSSTTCTDHVGQWVSKYAQLKKLIRRLGVDVVNPATAASAIGPNVFQNCVTSWKEVTGREKQDKGGVTKSRVWLLLWAGKFYMFSWTKDEWETGR